MMPHGESMFRLRVYVGNLCIVSFLGTVPVPNYGEVIHLSPKRRDSKSNTTPPEELPDAELEVLACLWQRQRATARQIREALHSYHPMAHVSVVTLLNRLQDRGFVARAKNKVGKAFIFRPTRAARPAQRRIVRRLVERVFGGDSFEVVFALFDAKLPTPDELDRLQRMLDDLRGKGGK